MYCIRLYPSLKKSIDPGKAFLQVCLVIFVIFLVSCGSGKAKEKSKLPPKKDSVSIKIIFAGDLMGHMPWINSGLKQGKHDFDTTYTFIEPYIKKADYAMLNLETTLNGPPYKGFPMFSSPDALAADAQQAGFDYMALANNHCYDRGRSGVRRTNYVLDSLKIPHTGSFNDTAQFEKNYPPIIEVKGIRIAVLNYTYGTNGLMVYPPNVVNLMDSTQILEGIKKAKAKKPDFIISIMHWGEEYSRKESPRQQMFAQLMAANGVDVIFGAHPHVVQPIKTFPSSTNSGRVVPVFYSVGNFICNQRDRYKDGGIFAEITICKVDGKTWLQDFAYMPFWIRKNESNRSYMAIPLNNWEKDKDQFHLPSSDAESAELFLNDTKKTIGDGVRISR
jgi:hypothetical protein